MTPKQRAKHRAALERLRAEAIRTGQAKREPARGGARKKVTDFE